MWRYENGVMKPETKAMFWSTPQKPFPLVSPIGREKLVPPGPIINRSTFPIIMYSLFLRRKGPLVLDAKSSTTTRNDLNIPICKHKYSELLGHHYMQKVSDA